MSTTTARRVLDELAANGFARKEGTRGHIWTGGPQAQQAPPAAEREQARKAPPPAGVPGRLTIRSAHTVPAGGSAEPGRGRNPGAADVRAERPPADVALALGAADPSRPVIVRRRLLSAADGHLSSFVSAICRLIWQRAPPSPKPRRFLRRGLPPWPLTSASRSTSPVATSPPATRARKRPPPSR